MCDTGIDDDDIDRPRIVCRAITLNDLNVGHILQIVFGDFRQLGVKLDRNDAPTRTADLSKDCAVVAGPCANMEDGVTWMYTQAIEQISP